MSATMNIDDNGVFQSNSLATVRQFMDARGYPEPDRPPVEAQQLELPLNIHSLDNHGLMFQMTCWTVLSNCVTFDAASARTNVASLEAMLATKKSRERRVVPSSDSKGKELPKWKIDDAVNANGEVKELTRLLYQAKAIKRHLDAIEGAYIRNKELMSRELTLRGIGR